MTPEQFIKDYTRTDSNELIAVEDIYGKKVISYREWLTPEQALRAVELARQNLWHPTTEKPYFPHGLIVMTDMGYIFEAVYEDGKFLVSTVRNHKVYFEESIEQECIIKWMKV